MSFDALTDETRALNFLSRHLSEGKLVLFLGAGASLGAGLPDWVTLISRLRKHAGLPNDKIVKGASADALQAAADEVRGKLANEEEFARLVKLSLYDGVKLTSDLVHDDLLIAVGALLMGSRRGKISRVVTFNFDSILEWYIWLYGFMPNVVSQPLQLEGAEDVRIYHPHGFLSHPDMKERDSSFVILGLDAINERLGTQGEKWFELTRHLLRTGVGLFVGLSPRTFDDRALAPLLVTVGKEVGDARPVGFWIICDESDRLSPDERESLEAKLLRHNVVPIYKPNHQDIPGFLMAICRQSVSMLAIK